MIINIIQFFTMSNVARINKDTWLIVLITDSTKDKDREIVPLILILKNNIDTTLWK